MTTPNDFEVAGVILDANCNMVAYLQAMAAKQIADLVGRVVELLIGQD